jgi:RNA polymerase sigma-70 factor, ECF subfamily
MNEKQIDIIGLFNSDFEKAVSLLFNNYYTELCRKAYCIVNDQDIAEDIVQDVFFKLWEKKSKIQIDTSLSAYLKRMVFNESISFLRKNKEFLEFSDDINQNQISDNPDYNLTQQELHAIISEAIEKLPPKCKTIFLLSRIEKLSYKEIADHLNLSVKTIENQMGKALKILRHSLKNYYLLFLVYFSDNF